MGFGSINCGNCSGIGTIRKSISNNCMTHICNVCGQNFVFNLLKIKKKIIYLDQNIFSIGYKRQFQDNTKNFLDLFDRLVKLANKQIIICPHSSLHDKETHLYKEGSNLYKFIKSVSRGKNFYYQSKIKDQQLVNAYLSYLNKGPIKSELLLSDAISDDVHDWDDSLRVDVNWSITNLITLNTLRQEKENFSDKIIQALPKWRSSSSSFEDDYKLEIYDHARIMWSTYINLLQSDNIEKQLESETFHTMSLLINLPDDNITPEIKFKNVIGFLTSEYFENVPYINISAGLWATIKKKIKEKQFLVEGKTEEKIKIIVRGLMDDIDHLSVFAPYCDAIFFEKTMARFFGDWIKNPLAKYSCKIFSKTNIEDFYSYLDKIESNITSQMHAELEFVYDN